MHVLGLAQSHIHRLAALAECAPKPLFIHPSHETLGQGTLRKAQRKPRFLFCRGLAVGGGGLFISRMGEDRSEGEVEASGGNQAVQSRGGTPPAPSVARGEC